MAIQARQSGETWKTLVTVKQVILAMGLIPACVAGAMCGTVQGRAATYVVDQAAPGAADTNPGTEDKPFKTVRRAVDLARPGDTVFVMAGKYEERVRVRTSGAEGRPITLRARPPRSAGVSGFAMQANYIPVEDF